MHSFKSFELIAALPLLSFPIHVLEAPASFHDTSPESPLAPRSRSGEPILFEGSSPCRMTSRTSDCSSWIVSEEKNWPNLGMEGACLHWPLAATTLAAVGHEGTLGYDALAVGGTTRNPLAPGVSRPTAGGLASPSGTVSPSPAADASREAEPGAQ